MDKIIVRTIGLIIIYFFLKAVITGKALGGTGGFTNPIYFESSPIEFSITILALGFGGIGLIWGTFRD